MTDRNPPYQPDEPIIGGSHPPTNDPHDLQGYIGEEADEAEWDDWEDEGSASPAGGPVIGSDDYEYGYDEGEEEYYGDEYYGDEPARQPIFYVFIAAALVVGALFVFLLFALFTGGDDEPTPADPRFNVTVDSPRNNDRVNIGEQVQVQVRATSTEQIALLELFVEGRSVGQQLFTEPPANEVYSATLTTVFDAPGRYRLSVRAQTISGASSDSGDVVVVAVETIDERPQQITGEIITTVNARSGPGDDYPSTRILEPGEQVIIEGRSPDNEWVLLDDGSWVRRNAVELNDSLVLVPIRRPTPTPAPTATATPEESPSPSPSPTVNAPDLSPTNASVTSGGSLLQVTIANLASSDYSGPIVVSASGLPGGDLVQVYDRELLANGTVTVDFPLDPPLLEGGTVQIAVDPDDAIEETSEDNNEATFVLAAPVEPPNLAIQPPTVQDNQVLVTIQNTGGDMPASTVVVAISLGDSSNQASKTISLANGQTESFTLAKPLEPGTATITVSIDGQEFASTTIEITN
jgi:hypothetical protein